LLHTPLSPRLPPSPLSSPSFPVRRLDSPPFFTPGRFDDGILPTPHISTRLPCPHSLGRSGSSLRRSGSPQKASSTPVSRLAPATLGLNPLFLTTCLCVGLSPLFPVTVLPFPFLLRLGSAPEIQEFSLSSSSFSPLDDYHVTHILSLSRTTSTPHSHPTTRHYLRPTNLPLQYHNHSTPPP